MSSEALNVDGVTFRYGEHVALRDVSFGIERSEVFGLLGPNGGGKTTLFRLLSTLVPLQDGNVSICGASLRDSAGDVRRKLGVTFQSPSLDVRLTVAENLRYQGMLYGITGRALSVRIDHLLELLDLTDRRRQTVETLSGGLKRRVEIAKSMLHDPEFLLLDEPSTGLDPSARLNLWAALQQLRRESGITVLVTTHLMDEAEKCDRLGILDRGSLVALGTPGDLRATVGGDCVTIRSEKPSDLDGVEEILRDSYGLAPKRFGDSLRVEMPDGHELVSRLMTEMPEAVQNVSIGKPTLEDVFVRHTGHQFWEGDSE